MKISGAAVTFLLLLATPPFTSRRTPAPGCCLSNSKVPIPKSEVEDYALSWPYCLRSVEFHLKHGKFRGRCNWRRRQRFSAALRATGFEGERQYEDLRGYCCLTPCCGSSASPGSTGCPTWLLLCPLSRKCGTHCRSGLFLPRP
ncbi:Hypothetical predicted protein [Podarcis lilfordi]|uniref:Uncharacterized protein n=1 Tax=Podarcis lilfordi TaxID=74358 RepID=A0AA35LFS5_9SAUR|nr:Hypothetical predicted protein [Podarcis lilfordi]